MDFLDNTGAGEDQIVNEALEQGLKLLTVRLSGTGKNGGTQVQILDTFPKERQNSITMDVVHRSRKGINSGGQVNILDSFPKERLNLFVISTPARGTRP